MWQLEIYDNNNREWYKLTMDGNGESIVKLAKELFKRCKHIGHIDLMFIDSFDTPHHFYQIDRT